MKHYHFFSLVFSLSMFNTAVTAEVGLPKKIAFLGTPYGPLYIAEIENIDFKQLEINPAKCDPNSDEVEYFWNQTPLKVNFSGEPYIVPRSVPECHEPTAAQSGSVLIKFTTPGCRLPDDISEIKYLTIHMRHNDLPDGSWSSIQMHPASGTAELNPVYCYSEMDEMPGKVISSW